MKVTNISKKRYNELQLVSLGKEICNSESVIYDLYIKKHHKVLKEINEKEGHYYATKLYTVEMLDYFHEYLPNSLCVPDSLAVVDNKTIGFTVPFINGTNLSTILNTEKINVEQIYYLRKVGQLLEQLKQIRKFTPLKDFYLNDIHESNFIVDTQNKDIKVIDLDSRKIGKNEVFPSRYASPCSLAQHVPSKYIVNENGHCGGFLIPNEDSEMYCYIMTIINYLFGGYAYRLNKDNFYVYLEYLEKIGIDKTLLSIFARIISEKPNMNPEPFLETLTPTNVYRAREEIYTLTKKNILKR